MGILQSIFTRLFLIRYAPDAAARDFLARAQTQECPHAQVTVGAPEPTESHRFFGVPTVRRHIQPIYLRVVNRGSVPLKLHLVSVDPNYFTPHEAAAVNHFSLAKRVYGFGLFGWLFFLPMLLLIPSKIISAWRANRRMNDFFQAHAFHLRPIPPGDEAEGFIFTPYDAGTKVVRLRLHAAEEALYIAKRGALAGVAVGLPALETGEQDEAAPLVDLTFSLPIAGISADHLKRDFSAICPTASLMQCDLAALAARLRELPATTTNHRGTGHGDPVNLAVIGDFASLLTAFAARWDESETITLATCWKTARAFMFGSEYRYSPVSPLYLFGRSQDVALQRTRRSINERLHLRLWLTPLVFAGRPVWVGQVSRDIGVRFTWKTWNLTTHRVDADVDEARDYIFEDLLAAGRIDAAGYVAGVGSSTPEDPRRNLTGDQYFTDGKRVAVLLSPANGATS